MFDELPLFANMLIFAVLATLIWNAGTRLSYFIDAIAEKTNIARAFLGLILLATATELPELVTTTTASSRGNGTLALNNMFGGMLMQLLVLAIADIFVKKGTLSAQPKSPTVAIAGLLCITSLAAVLIANVLSDFTIAFHIGIGSILIAGLYMTSMFILHSVDKRDVWSPVDLPEDKVAEKERKNRYDEKSLKALILYALIAGIVIFFCGVFLVRLAETLATQTGLGSSFIGATLLALSTSMPELSTSIAAVRVKAYSMAISNVLGSNMIMVFLIFPNDLAFTNGPIINEIDTPARFALCAGIFMTGLYSIGLLTRPKRKFAGMGIDSIGIVICYFASLWIMFTLR
ncbi:MAG: sodium:calcium antiporter [Alphaproteobacteria bacterium]